MKFYATKSSHISSPKIKLDLVESVFSFKKIPDLENVVIVGAQHILPSTLTMLNSFFERGLSPKNVFLIGKCYSTDPITYNLLRDIGVYVCPSSSSFIKEAPFDSYYISNVKSFIKYTLNAISNRDKKHIIIVDDGGILISQLNDYFDASHPFCGVEQTTSGFRLLEHIDLNFGVVNVARSHAKLQYESKIIAKTIIKEFNDKLLHLPSAPERILIIGNGAVGGTISNALEGRFDVYVVDIDPHKSALDLNKTLSNLSNFELIFGCVGQQIVSLEQINKLKKGTVLASASSSDREFDIVSARGESSDISTCHDDFSWNGIKVLNCGFPLNFNGKGYEVDIEEFELTRSLLALGILQALGLNQNRGCVPLCELGQQLIIDQFRKKYSQTRASYDRRLSSM